MTGSCLAVLALLIADAACAQPAAPPPEWQDITAAATASVVPETGTPEGFSPEALRDGSVAAASRIVGHANLNARFRMQFAWSAFGSRWEWPKAQAIAAVDLIVADPPTAHAAPGGGPTRRRRQLPLHRRQRML